MKGTLSETTNFALQAKAMGCSRDSKAGEINRVKESGERYGEESTPYMKVQSPGSLRIPWDWTNPV